MACFRRGANVLTSLNHSDIGAILGLEETETSQVLGFGVDRRGGTLERRSQRKETVLNEPKVVVATSDSCKILRAFGDEVTVLIGGQESGGKLTAFIDVTPPGGGPPPHYHENEDEWFFPLEGRVEFHLGGAWREVPIGSIVFAPRRSVHTFRNIGDEPLRMLIQTAPSGFEVFFERSAEEFAKAGPPDMQRLVEIGREHGIHFV